ncbi:hypothetical protein [Micromonospora sp. WMMD1082]|uniref:hypothetical protein n=1 Tax=Micromonospora sp. WMMD1082 TaxID=3016104 RepID=UPI00241780A7|nr:hypothetical protein [Micromonospora sp. WMMD1082]MDG4796010.1 hypothetical protein [Micromonospora sp. WMMD1082]
MLGHAKNRLLAVGLFRRQIFEQVTVQQRGEGFCHLEPLHRAVLSYVQRLEQPLVDQPAQPGYGNQILPLAPLCDLKRRRQRAFHVSNFTGSRSRLCFSISHLGGQPVHLALEHVQRHRSGVVRGKQLLPFVAEASDPQLGSLTAAVGFLTAGGQFVQYAIADKLSSLGRQPERAVELCDAILNPLQPHRLARAGPSARAPGKAGEVLVLAAVAPVAAVDQAGTALTAED